MKKVVINLSNRLHYTLIVVGIILVLGVGVYAFGVGGVSHSADEIFPPAGCQDGQALIKQGNSWTCGDVGSGLQSGYNIFYFDNLARILNDGAFVSEINCGYSTGSFCGVRAYGESKIENGKIFTRAWANGCGMTCDTGFVEGISGCMKDDGTAHLESRAIPTLDGLLVEGPGYSLCTNSGSWE